MKRIIYLSPFAADNIAGGIKVMFGHVAMLRDLGYDACVFSPAGRPVWFSTDEPLFSGPDLLTNPDHLLVFPELLNGKLGEWALAEMQASKILLCQNQYYAFSEALQARPLGWAWPITSSTSPIGTRISHQKSSPKSPPCRPHCSTEASRPSPAR